MVRVFKWVKTKKIDESGLTITKGTRVRLVIETKRPLLYRIAGRMNRQNKENPTSYRWPIKKRAKPRTLPSTHTMDAPQVCAPTQPKPCKSCASKQLAAMIAEKDPPDLCAKCFMRTRTFIQIATLFDPPVGAKRKTKDDDNPRPKKKRKKTAKRAKETEILKIAHFPPEGVTGTLAEKVAGIL